MKKHTRWFALIAMLLAFACALSACADKDGGKKTDGNKDDGITGLTASVGLEYFPNDDFASYSVTGIGTCKDANVVIPATYNNLPVTSIGDEVFEYCENLTSIKIPDSVTSIGNEAFEGTSLKNITIPDSVTSIGDSAFAHCDSLTSVHITDLAAWCNISFYGVFSNPLIYAENLYINGVLATDITVPTGVTSIAEWAFVGCSSLTSITIPDSVKSIGDYPFSGCDSLSAVYYSGTADAWSNITIGSDSFYNTSATVYYSKTEPTDDGNYWHYVGGAPTPW